MLVLGIAALFIAYRSVSIPDANAEYLTQTTKVYYSDGKLKIEGEGRPAQAKPGGRQSGKHVETHGFAPPGAGGSVRGDR